LPLLLLQVICDLHLQFLSLQSYSWHILIGVKR